MDYEEFIASKRYEWAACGFDAVDMNDSLYPFQRDVCMGCFMECRPPYPCSRSLRMWATRMRNLSGGRMA